MVWLAERKQVTERSLIERSATRIREFNWIELTEMKLIEAKARQGRMNSLSVKNRSAQRTSSFNPNSL